MEFMAPLVDWLQLQFRGYLDRRAAQKPWPFEAVSRPTAHTVGFGASTAGRHGIYGAGIGALRLVGTGRKTRLQARPEVDQWNDSLCHGRAGAEDAGCHLQNVPEGISVVFL